MSCPCEWSKNISLQWLIYWSLQTGWRSPILQSTLLVEGAQNLIYHSFQLMNWEHLLKADKNMKISAWSSKNKFYSSDKMQWSLSSHFHVHFKWSNDGWQIIAGSLWGSPLGQGISQRSDVCPLLPFTFWGWPIFTFTFFFWAWPHFHFKLSSSDDHSKCRRRSKRFTQT